MKLLNHFITFGIIYNKLYEMLYVEFYEEANIKTLMLWILKFFHFVRRYI